MKIRYQLFLLLFFFIITSPLFHANAETRTLKVLTAEPGTTSKELQELLNYNKDNKYDLVIKIPEGRYNLLKELRIYSNTTIIADDNAKLMKNHCKGSLLTNDLSNDKGGYTTAVNIKISGGIWDSKNIADLGKGTESFRFIHASNITIKNATICNVPQSSHLITFAGVKNGTIENCKIYGYDGTKLKEAIQIDIVHDNVIVPSNQSSKIKYDDLPCNGITITNNEIYDYPRAIGSHTSIKGVFHKNIVISGNKLHDIDEAAIKAYNYVNLQITNNTIKNCGVGILVYTQIDNSEEHYLSPLSTTKTKSLPDNYHITITGNHIQDIHKYQSGSNKLWGDGIRIIGSKNRPISGLTIQKNKISGTKRFGIYMNYALSSNIKSNTITKTTSHAILIDHSNYNKIYYNKIYYAGKTKSSNGGIGISASKNTTVYKNYIKSAANNGIFLYNKSTGCVIKGNYVISAGVNAIAIHRNSNNSDITSNIITGKKNRGIYVYGAYNTNITYNEVKGYKKSLAIATSNSKHSTLYKNVIKK